MFCAFRAHAQRSTPDDGSLGASRKHRGPQLPSRLTVRHRRGQARLRVLSKARVVPSKRKETEWESEFAPGNSAARRPACSGGIQHANMANRSMVECWASQNSDRKKSRLGPLGAKLIAKWEALPARYKLVFATSWAFVICNMDKVNISVAIIPMAQDFGWSSTVSGLIQSSFFYGYALTQIPGGYVVSRLGGRKVLPAGVGLWSAATAATPILAGTLPGLLFCRAAVGLGEGVAPTSATDMVARVIDQKERSRAISFIFAGLHVGSLAGLLLAPPLIERFGWPVVFYMFGAVGGIWALGWERLMAGIHEEDPSITEQLEGQRLIPGEAAGAESAPVPWRAFLRNGPTRALAYTHFCNNWFHYTFAAWLPSYFSDTLSLNLSQAAQVSLFPPVAAIAASAIAGPAADYLISEGWPVTRVRKIAQAIAFLGPAACLSLAMTLGEGDEVATVGLISAGLGLASFSLAGLYSNHADLSQRHASILLGLTNTMGAIPGIIGVTITGLILDKTGDWNQALFLPSIFFFVTGASAFAAYGSSETQDYSVNAPFSFEKYVWPVMAQIPKLPSGNGNLFQKLQRHVTKRFPKL